MDFEHQLLSREVYEKIVYRWHAVCWSAVEWNKPDRKKKLCTRVLAWSYANQWFRRIWHRVLCERKKVCREAWLLAHQMNKETFRRIHLKFKDGVLVSEHGNKGRKTVMSKTSDCIAWLQFFINSVGDHQPDKRSIHLPSCFSKSDIYKKMLEENTSLNQPTVSLSHFYNI